METIKIGRKIRVERNCIRCGEYFLSRTYWVKVGGALYCSKSCRARSYRASTETKLKQSRAKSGSNHPKWKGGSIKKNGRIALHLPTSSMAMKDGYVYRYRKIMSDHIGRDLKHDEIVHHVNGDGSDDRIQNLRMMKSSEHARLHATQSKRKPKCAETSPGGTK